LRQKYTLECAAAGLDGPGKKFCIANIGTRADFVIDRLKIRCSIRPQPVRKRPHRLRRTSNARKCSINTIIRTLVISSPFALFRRRPFARISLRACVPATCNEARHRFAPIPQPSVNFRRYGAISFPA
jgi:hypothetical protein